MQGYVFVLGYFFVFSRVHFYVLFLVEIDQRL